MPQFPLLKTGAVAQYPLEITSILPVSVMRFLDGSEQRFQRRKSPVRSWLIRLRDLDDSEARALAEFFEASRGSHGYFEFTDPVSGVVYDRCRFSQDSMAVIQKGELSSDATVVVISD